MPFNHINHQPVCPECGEPYVGNECIGKPCSLCAEEQENQDAQRGDEFEDSLRSCETGDWYEGCGEDGSPYNL